MIERKLFPEGSKLTSEMECVIKAFENNESSISSIKNAHQLKSNEVLSIVSKDLLSAGFQVETNKQNTITMNVKISGGYGDKFFYPDAFHAGSKAAVEVEAGMAVCNYRFLKDFFEALVCDVDYLIIAVRQEYWGGKRKTAAKDFNKVVDYLTSWFQSERLEPFGLKGVLIIGY